MVVQQPGDLQWQTNCVSNLQNSNTIRCLQKGLGGILSESISGGSVDSPGVKPPYQCSGIVSHQTSPFNVFEKVQSQISPFPSRQYECPFIPDENGVYKFRKRFGNLQCPKRSCLLQSTCRGD